MLKPQADRLMAGAGTMNSVAPYQVGTELRTIVVIVAYLFSTIAISLVAVARIPHASDHEVSPSYSADRR